MMLFINELQEMIGSLQHICRKNNIVIHQYDMGKWRVLAMEKRLDHGSCKTACSTGIFIREKMHLVTLEGILRHRLSVI